MNASAPSGNGHGSLFHLSRVDKAGGALKQLQADDEVLFGVFADALDQLLGLIEGLVGMVVEGAILYQLAERALAFVYAFED